VDVRFAAPQFRLRVVSFLSFMSVVWVALKAKNVRSGHGDLAADLPGGFRMGDFGCEMASISARIRDLWPEFAVDMGVLKNPILIWMARRLERFLYARANHMLVNSPAYREYLIGLASPHRRSASSQRLSIPTCSMLKKRRGPAKRIPTAGQYIVTYAGAMGMANNLEIVLEAATMLNDVLTSHFLMVGDGKDRNSWKNSQSSCR